MTSESLDTLAKRVLDACFERGVMLNTAESCTSGMIVAALTEIAGSSRVVDRGFVTYSNDAKHEMLGVARHLLDNFGAVSEEVARAMAHGAMPDSRAGIAVSVTGIAGPGGGSDEKPVGLVHMTVALRHEDQNTTTHRQHIFSGDRAMIREKTVAAALDLVLEILSGSPMVKG